MISRFPIFTAFLVLLAAGSARAEIQVFILAGQSNMEGKAKVTLLEYQLSQPETRERFAHLQDKKGRFIERDDVFIKYLDRNGKLTVGYGSPGRIGPELGFGFTMGDHFKNEPVLLIKTAWGGKSLYRDFRPPSSGLPPQEVRETMLQKSQKKNPDMTLNDVDVLFGKYYRLMIEDVRATLEDIGDYVPGGKREGYRIAGFAWFQGWNDMINADFTAEYAKNMANFIRDVRKDLEVADMPFVIGVLGVGGTKEENLKKDKFKLAQGAAAELPEFKGNVAVVQTDKLWDETAQAVYSKGWKQNLEEWEKVGSDYPYHYLGSPKAFLAIGEGLAKALLELK